MSPSPVMLPTAADQPLESSVASHHPSHHLRPHRRSYDLGLFWSELLGRPLADDESGDVEVLVRDPAEGPSLLLVR
ncbi:hypothetical protein [Streptomyces adelaidensis]|uniref:hypothetical protein n=1 Tax=Streptomyces adelaidensis TaxID=2796465 RepID=UPI00190545DF|nr:hypothetical protein [Streptomyces adelaidensis]